MKKLLFLLLLAGCGTNKDIVKIDDDTYALGSESRYASAGSVKAQLHSDANAFCAASGKKLQLLGDKTVEYANGNSGVGAQIQFRCK